MGLLMRRFKDVNLDDPFFDSLKDDYAEFLSWFTRKAEETAYIFVNDSGALEGFLYVKVEDGPVSDVVPPLRSARRLKVGTFKINAHGTKLGERFVKKVFDHAVFEGVDEVYVTVFGKHTPLIGLLERYGFRPYGQKHTANGTEEVLLKPMTGPYEDVVSSYPLIHLDGGQAYLLSIYPEWHTRLLPDSILKTESAEIVTDVSHTNSIHKVYLARMQGMEALRKGDVLLIYRTSDGKGAAYFRSVATSICVVEEYRSIFSFECERDFKDYCRPYSVFGEDELSEFWATKKYPHVIRFTYNVALTKRVTRGQMIEALGFPADDYWGFMPLSRDQIMLVVRKGLAHEGVIVD